jgi:hypothetical protein
MALLTKPVHKLRPDEAAPSNHHDLHISLLRLAIDHVHRDRCEWRMPASGAEDFATTFNCH